MAPGPAPAARAPSVPARAVRPQRVALDEPPHLRDLGAGGARLLHRLARGHAVGAQEVIPGHLLLCGAIPLHRRVPAYVQQVYSLVHGTSSFRILWTVKMGAHDICIASLGIGLEAPRAAWFRRGRDEKFFLGEAGIAPQCAARREKEKRERSARYCLERTPAASSLLPGRLRSSSLRRS